jgi:hypothetical protein
MSSGIKFADFVPERRSGVRIPDSGFRKKIRTESKGKRRVLLWSFFFLMPEA